MTDARHEESLILPAIAMLGVGNMNGAILAGLTRDGSGPASPIRVTNRSDASAAQFAGNARVEALSLEGDAAANSKAVQGAGIVIVGVKPHLVAEVLDGVRDALEPGAVVISVAAGVTIAAIEARVPDHARVVRAMPNTPATIGLGVTGIAGGKNADAEALALARAVFASVGEVVTVEESQLDALTAVSGSGPAYVYLFVEELVHAGIAEGLAPDVARTLAVGTFRGASEMLARNPEIDPAELRRRVTSPNGTTERAIQVMQGEGLGEIMHRAVQANIRRAEELARENQ